MDRLHAAALVHGDVDDDRALLHARYHLLRDEDRGAGAGDQHGADEEIGAAQHLVDVEAVRHDRDHAAVEEVVDGAQAVEVHVEDRDVGAQAERDAGGVDSDGAGAEDGDVARGHARHAGQQDAAAAVGLGEIEGALLHGQAPGHLAHRRQ